TSGGRLREIGNGAVYAPRGKYGYEYVKRDRAKEVMPGVRPQPAHADVVRSMFRRRAQGRSYERIATELTEDGVDPPSVAEGHKKQSRRWHEGQVRRIIQDPAYMGQGSWRKSTFVVGARGKRVRRARPDDEQPIDVAYPPLVTPEEWHAANAPGNSGRALAVRACAEHS